MAEILVLVEHTDGNVKKVTLELLTLARALGEPAAVIVGDGYDTAKDKLAEYGATKVYVVQGDGLDKHPVAPVAEALAAVVEQSSPAAVLVASSADGKEAAARLAVRLGSGIITDAVGVSSELVADQSVFGGATLVKSKVTHGVPVITVRPNSTPPGAQAGAAERVDVSIELSEAAKKAAITDKVVAAKDGRPDLTEASIVVSGGRGVGSAENFAIIEKLADSLGAAVGASRAATDAGYYPHQYQVGQTGKTVSPQLYIAAGISGAIQHRAGMQTSKTIIAINKDAEAPIFELADFGVVGDLNAVVPQLTEEISKRKG
ncbi:MAG: electron transfer flavoprotein subunit alpha/FixB family protein [Candidatus Nanopelagicales bacterium]